MAFFCTITINKLIKGERTGTPKAMSKKLAINELTAHVYLSFMRKQLNAPIKWMYFTIHVKLPDTTGNQLCVLRTEIEDQNGFMHATKIEKVTAAQTNMKHFNISYFLLLAPEINFE